MKILKFLPIEDGEGNRAKRGGGVTASALDGSPLHHEQVDSAPHYPAMSGGHGDLLISGGSPPHRFATGRNRESGFTLVELMVVIVIIGLLATVVVINVMPATDKAALTKARADIATLEQGVEMYRLNKLTYPAGADGLQAVVREGYVKRLPKDPWGNPYLYAAPGRDGRSFDIFSHGADGREGGEDEDADIGSWQS